MAKQKAKGEALHEREILTSELGAIVGKTPQWIRQLTREGVLKQVDRGKYILGESVQAYIEHVAGGSEDNKKPRLNDVKTEHELIKKEKSELELAKLRGELHAAKDVERVMSDMILSVKSKLLALPARLAPQLAHESAEVVEKVIRKEINVALSSLADYRPDMFGQREGSG
jgi:hypothetical protein